MAAVPLANLLKAAAQTDEEAQGETGDGEDRGYAPPPDFPEDDSYLPPHDDPWNIGECSNVSDGGWKAVPAYLGPDVDPFKALVIYPESGFTPGWSEIHQVWTTEAIEDSLDLYNAASSPCLQVVLSVHGGSSSYVLDTTASGVCGIFLNTPMQARQEAQFKQEIARDIAHCIVPIVWPDQFEVTSFTNRRWWNGALAEFLSNAVYPDPTCQNSRCDLEWRHSGAMAAQELTTPMMYRQDANWLFFQYLWWRGGLEGVFDLANSIPASSEPIDHQQAIAGIAGMSENFHEFIEQLSDSAIQDSGGGTIPYNPPAEELPVSGKQTIQRNPEPFGTKRLHLTVDPGMFACIESTTGETVTITYRPGGPGSGDGWEPLPTEETVYSGEILIVATTTEPDGTFSIVVNDVRDESDCEDDEESETPDAPDLPCLELCGPSDFYQYLDQLAEWFKSMVEAMMPESHHVPGFHERALERANPIRLAFSPDNPHPI